MTTGLELPSILGTLSIYGKSSVVLDKNVESSLLSFDQGSKLITGSDTLVINGTTPITSNESTYVRGNLGWRYTVPATRVYPVGSASAYRPVTLNVTALHFSSGTSGVITVSQTDSAPAKSSLPAGVSTISRIRYFTLSRSANISSDTSDVKLSWGPDDGVSNPSTLTVVHGNASTGGWDRADSTGGKSGTASSGTVTGRGFTAAGNYVLGTTAGDNPLAVEVVSFTAATVTGGVALAWQTLTETNNLGFYVERRMNGVTAWMAVSPLIPGAGTSSDEHSYTWTDSISVRGTYFYRLREVELTGDVTYTQEIQVNFRSVLGVADPAGPKTFALGQNYPNPFNPSTVIRYQLPVESAVTLRVYSVLGEFVQTLLSGVRPAGYGSVELDAHNMASGAYFYRLEAAGTADPTRGFTQVRRMLIVR